MMADLDFSFVAEELKRAEEFFNKAPAIVPRLLAYHKYVVDIRDIRRTQMYHVLGVYRAFGSNWVINVIDEDKNVVWTHYFKDIERPTLKRFGGILLEDYMNGNVHYNRSEKDTNDIQFDTIEELDLKLSLRGY